MARLPKQFDNETVFIHLNDYWSLSNFNQSGNPKDVWLLDDILTGVANLDYGGNTRPLLKRKLFSLLATLQVITSDAIKEITQCSESHARRLAAALRIASRAFAAQLHS